MELLGPIRKQISWVFYLTKSFQIKDFCKFFLYYNIAILFVLYRGIVDYKYILISFNLEKKLLSLMPGAEFKQISPIV